MCESGLAYEGAMIIATLVDMVESEDQAIYRRLSLLQRQYKVGLTSLAAVGLYEVGFADRIVATALSGAFPAVTDYASARQAVRANQQQTRALLGQFPSYFTYVLDDLVGG